MAVIIDYHLVFMVTAIALMLLEIIILFFNDEETMKKYIGLTLLIGFNMNLCMISSLSFLAINIPGFDTSGNLIDNATAEMWMFFAMFLGLFLVNLGLLFYTHISLFRLKAVPNPNKKIIR